MLLKFSSPFQYTLGTKDEVEFNEEGACDRKSDSEEDDEGSCLVDDIQQVTLKSDLDSQNKGGETLGEVVADGHNDTDLMYNGLEHSENEISTGNSLKDVKHSKSLEKRRRQAASAVRAGTKSHSSRNASKDKGGRRSRHGGGGNNLDF